MVTLVEALVVLVRDVSAMREFTGATGALRVECVRLVRKVSLLSHLLEEIQDSVGNAGAACVAASSSSSRAASPVSCLADLLFAVEAVKRFLQLVCGSGSNFAGKNIALQLQYVELVLSQLRQATEKIGALNIKDIFVLVTQINFKLKCDADQMQCNVAESPKTTRPSGPLQAIITDTNPILEAKMKEDTCSYHIAIPEDFCCPITLELMRDPVIVSTGQTYQRSSIQRWIDCGNQTSPKTQQKLQNLTLTPNYALRSLIMQWCGTHNVEQPCRISGKLRKCNGSFMEVCGDRTTIDALVHKLSSSSNEERKSAVADIRSLAKTNSGNRILIAEAGAIPTLIQEHAVTSILNLSIYDNNKQIIMFAGAIDPIIQVLLTGSIEARENAAAAIFNLSVIDENKITIGSISGAIEALVELLNFGSSRGKKDAPTALFNLCVYQGNKARAIRVGVLTPLLKMLKDSSSYCMVDEVLTILSVLVSHREGKVAIAKACIIPLLIDLLRTGQPHSKENAAAILLALCKKDGENLACVGMLGAFIPLTELARSGTNRAKRKASSLLEHLRKLHML
ncbi:Zinc finger RING/FYVE/PHD-type protein [Dioscorea alata]|uniref:Zinc finger RING/FYVE/PHD-type protein n=1 Tax=Dioscorea alata TaxID=55571 RepID=A0ACB7U6M1_DIOAL|nr:Zinc finger RING/FYVE/PHD-type protein [Dioscorea alata]